MKKPGQGFARRVTVDNLEEFKGVLQTSSRRAPSSSGKDTESGGRSGTDIASLFTGTAIPVHLPSKRRPETKSIKERIPGPRGPLVWRKVELSRTDAQRQVGNPTGDLRLTQAKFEVGGGVIDQTRYFRHEVFGEGDWTLERQSPRVETADFVFDVTILGDRLGPMMLAVSHKPTGEAGQGNYTTGVRWGPLLDILAHQIDVTGKTLSLYGPPRGAKDPFFIEIT